MDSAYPPYEYLCRLADNNPQAIKSYLMLWREQDSTGKIVYDKDHIRNIKSLSWAKFLNDLRLLYREGLLEWHALRQDEQDHVMIIIAQYYTESLF